MTDGASEHHLKAASVAPEEEHPQTEDLRAEIHRLRQENTRLLRNNAALVRAHEESEKARQVLEDSEENLRSILDSAPIAVGISDVKSSQVLYLNEGCAAMFGTQVECETDTWVNEKERQRFLKDFERGSIPTREVLFRRVDGTEFWGVTTWRPIAYEGKDCILYWVYDTDRRKRAEEELLRAYDNLERLVSERTTELSGEVSWRKRVENELRRTLNALDDAVIAVDGDGTVERMNTAAERLAGKTFQEAAGRPFEDILDAVPLDDQGPLRSLRACLETGEPVIRTASEYRLPATNKTAALSEAASPIRDSQGQLVGAVTIIRDITEQHRLEQQLRHVQKMESIGQLAGGVAHDFNNMLGAILGAAELMSLDAGDRSENVRIITSTAERAAGLTRKLLSFSRKTSAEKRPFELKRAILDAVSMMERAVDKNVVIRTEFCDEKKRVVGDVTAIQNAILNLGINGAHAMPDGGELRIASSVVHLGAEFCVRSPFEIEPGPYGLITVDDHGEGMAPDVLERVFEPFFTTKAPGKGTGLGLSAVYGTVQGHSGAISIRSEPRRGTSVHLYFPLSESKPRRRDRNVPLRGEGLVLVVDDEPAIRLTAKGMLESLGYEVVVAENGVRGLELFLEHRARLRFVLLDVVMPELGGADCLREIRSHDPEIPVVMSSGFTRDTAVGDLQSLGISGFIEKPFSLSHLAQAASTASGKKVD